MFYFGTKSRVSQNSIAENVCFSPAACKGGQKVEKMFKIDRRHLENKLNVR